MRVTARCLADDLLLSREYVTRDARSFCAEHEFLRAFVIKREGAPADGEPVKGIEPFPRFRSLHRGRTRGVTVWDEEEDVCWLVAYGETHASGEDRDCYNYFVSLGERGELMPTPDDYEALYEVSAESVLDGLAGVSKDLYEEARNRPGIEASGSFGDTQAFMLVDLMVIDDGECEQGWLAITVPTNVPSFREVIVDYVALLLPEHVDPAMVEVSPTFGERPCRWDEVAWTWTTYAMDIPDLDKP